MHRRRSSSQSGPRQAAIARSTAPHRARGDASSNPKPVRPSSTVSTSPPVRRTTGGVP